MVTTHSSRFDQLLDLLDTLSSEEQAALIELVMHRRAEQRRADIAKNAAETLEALRDGRARYGTIDDLKNDLQAEP